MNPMEKNSKNLGVQFLIAALILIGVWVYVKQSNYTRASRSDVFVSVAEKTRTALADTVTPQTGVAIPVVWGDLGAKLVSVGAIDAAQFRALYQARNLWTPEYERLLTGNENSALAITRENAGVLLNMFWALGLASKNSVLEKGPMQSPAYGGAGNFASTGGWTLAQGSAMSHYSRHLFFTLTPEQQVLVEKVAKGIYRPCCDNSTYFPDCNHGMAMLGLLELMASQGVSEEEMWKTALAVNSFWFSDTYETIATYMARNGIAWSAVNPQEVLGASFSSASGFRKISAQVVAPERQGSGSNCGVGVPTAPAPRPQSGCDVGAPPALVPQKPQSGGCGV